MAASTDAGNGIRGPGSWFGQAGSLPALAPLDWGFLFAHVPSRFETDFQALETRQRKWILLQGLSLLLSRLVSPRAAVIN